MFPQRHAFPYRKTYSFPQGHAFPNRKTYSFGPWGVRGRRERRTCQKTKLYTGTACAHKAGYTNTDEKTIPKPKTKIMVPTNKLHQYTGKACAHKAAYTNTDANNTANAAKKNNRANIAHRENSKRKRKTKKRKKHES